MGGSLLRLRAWPLRAALLYALWLLLVGSLQLPELLAGAVATGIGMAGIAAARRHLPSYRLDPRLLRSLLPLPWELVRDTAIVLARLPARPSGRFRCEPVAVPRGPRGRALQAFAEARGTLAPNAYVVDVDAVERLALLHELDPRFPGKPL